MSQRFFIHLAIIMAVTNFSNFAVLALDPCQQKAVEKFNTKCIPTCNAFDSSPDSQLPDESGILQTERERCVQQVCQYRLNKAISACK